jgi:hypothetical protein
MTHEITDRVEVARGELTNEQILVLDRALVHHCLPPSLPYSTPETLAFVCLKCGSIGESPTREDRDILIDHYDVVCCGLTVIFHSEHRVLKDPGKISYIVRKVT